MYHTSKISFPGVDMSMTIVLKHISTRKHDLNEVRFGVKLLVRILSINNIELSFLTLEN